MRGRAYKQTWRKAKWNVPATLKQLKIAKRKVGLNEKKHENVKLKEDVPRAILLREKPDECNISSSVPKQTHIFSIAGDVCLWYSIKCPTGSS